MRPVGVLALLLWTIPLLAESGSEGQPATRPAIAPASVYDDRPISFRSGGSGRGSIAGSQAGRGESSFGYARWAVSLGVVLGLIFVARYAGRRMMGLNAQSSSGVIGILARQNLSPRQQLLLVQVGRRILLVAGGDGPMSTLAEISDPDEMAEVMAQANRRRMAAAASFGSVFGKAADAYVEPVSESASPQASPPESPPAANAELAAARSELSNLLQKVRLVSSVARR